ncbi:DUF2268 domain-containing putative Zn-dependent protease [Novosphingobium sp. BL-8H]|uniref:gliding motility protein GldB-related protein n=1 Tax=Novosphingobium sp. BL-8H TaxID=3127640 RepID=UPI003757C673
MIRRLAAFALCLSAPLSAAGAPVAPQILTEDVDRFFRLYDDAGGHPTAEQLDSDYLAPGTAGLHEIAKLRSVTGARIAANIAAHLEVYAKARTCLSVLPAVKLRLASAFARLSALYPEAKNPPVTFVIGRGRPVGITDSSGVTMGLEALCSADFMDPNVEDRFVHTIAHEYGHIQQSPAQQALEPDTPQATVLTMSLMEGAGEFTAELISGGVGNYQHAVWIETAFLRDADKTDLSAWMYNGVGDAAQPGDLGYWVGYRIIKAYYLRAHDKQQALREIYAMPDPKAFLAKSGWKPGMTIPG